MLTEDQVFALARSVVNDPALEPETKIGPDGKPVVVVTHCNQGLSKMLMGMAGYGKFDGMLADDIYQFVQKPESGWEKCTMADALQHAIDRLSIACQYDVPHGHVTKILPRMTIYSSKWEASVPFCANVGKSNGIVGVNWAFATMPDFFMLKEAIV